MSFHPQFDPSSPPIYIHGLEGSANGTKGKFVRATYGRSGPQMDAKAGEKLGVRPPSFEPCFEVCKAYIEQTKASVLVGSSFGGAMTMALLQAGVWQGPVVLLAPAIKRYGFDLKLPQGVHALIIHDPNDDLIPYEDSIELQQSNPKNAILWKSDGGHKLETITTNGLLKKAIDEQIARALKDLENVSAT